MGAAISSTLRHFDSDNNEWVAHLSNSVTEMFRLALLVLLSATSVLAVHEDVVDRILAAIPGKLGQVSAPYYLNSFTQRVASANINFNVMLQYGKMSIASLTRNGDVVYSTDDSVATFKVNAVLRVKVNYRYSMSSRSSTVSAGTAAGDWVSDVAMTITVGSSDPTDTSGCQVVLTSSRTTKDFDLHLEPGESQLYPLTIHFSAGDVVENKILPTFNDSLNKVFNGLKICDIIDCGQ